MSNDQFSILMVENIILMVENIILMVESIILIVPISCVNIIFTIQLNKYNKYNIC